MDLTSTSTCHKPRLKVVKASWSSHSQGLLTLPSARYCAPSPPAGQPSPRKPMTGDEAGPTLPVEQEFGWVTSAVLSVSRRTRPSPLTAHLLTGSEFFAHLTSASSRMRSCLACLAYWTISNFLPGETPPPRDVKQVQQTAHPAQLK